MVGIIEGGSLMSEFKPFLSTIAVSFLFAAGLVAQVPSRPEIVGAGTIENLDAVLEEMSQSYFSGRWDLLQERIGRLDWGRKAIGRRIDPSANFYLVVFLSHEEGGAPRLVRFAWHTPAPEPYAARIPGRKEIFEIVLGAGSDMELRTSYQSTRKENPLLEQVPRFVKKIESALLGASIKRTGPTQASTFNFEVRRIELPFARAKIKIADIAVVSNAATGKAVRAAVSRQAEFLEFRRPENKALIAALADAIRRVGTGGEWARPADEYGAAVDEALKAHLRARSLRGEALEQAVAVEREFLDMIDAARGKDVKGDFEYENVPLQRIGFGLASGILLGKTYAAERVRLTDDGYYAADPPKNPLAAVLFDFHPVPYDPEAATMTAAERFRLFAGAVLNPDLGICAGAGYGLLRGLSLNAGMALTGISVVKDPQAVVVGGRDKRVPGNPQNPFATKWKAVGFLGFEYSF